MRLARIVAAGCGESSRRDQRGVRPFVECRGNDRLRTLPEGLPYDWPGVESEATRSDEMATTICTGANGLAIIRLLGTPFAVHSCSHAPLT